MASRFDPLVMAALRRLPPELAHGIALRALRHGLARCFYQRTVDDPALAIEAFGLHFTNPIGLAAGFDKGTIGVDADRLAAEGLVEAA